MPKKTKNKTEASLQNINNQFFTQKLLLWHRKTNDRKMPWKGISNPYRIWLSEIILQQTRVEQGMAYYTRFITKYPTITALANAPQDSVYKDWEGLGYYNRCRNMQATAQRIRDEFEGVFPNDYATILSLKGIGPYTAAAISSFAFGLPYAVVDGNVIRVLSRFFGLFNGFEKAKDKQFYEQKAQSLLNVKEPAMYNQAIMDFGATVCTPQNPNCTKCPFQKKCYAFKKGEIAALPPKKKKIVLKERYLQYLLILEKGGVYIEKRKAGDIWSGLHQFYLKEQKTRPVSWKSAQLLDKQKQALSHQKIYSTYYKIDSSKIGIDLGSMILVPFGELKNYAFPRSLISFLKRFDYI